MKRAILLAAFGAGNPYGRAGLGAFEAECRARFPGLPIRWAYTSPILRERLARQKQKSDSVAKALWRLHFENFDSVAIQPLQTLPGREYEELCLAVDEVRGQGRMECAVGKPLLGASMAAVTAALLQYIPELRLPDENVIFMGHGAKHAAQSLYVDLGSELAKTDSRVFIGTMAGALCLEKLLPKLSSREVWLLPLLSCIGQHALRDMAGSEPQSWKTRLERAGHFCRPVLSGMVESPGLANIWLGHLEVALATLA